MLKAELWLDLPIKHISIFIKIVSTPYYLKVSIFDMKFYLEFPLKLVQLEMPLIVKKAVIIP